MFTKLKMAWRLWRAWRKADKMLGKVTKTGIIMLVLAVLALVAKLVAGQAIDGTDIQKLLDALIALLGMGGGTVALAGVRRAVGRVENK